ncbi:hypothetical protein EV424DRAFT_1541952 [Suillus variegatus]|nr:hypothetical protein EV424DRAFT_1541952 [Suillus variegatus]
MSSLPMGVTELFALALSVSDLPLKSCTSASHGILCLCSPWEQQSYLLWYSLPPICLLSLMSLFPMGETELFALAPPVSDLPVYTRVFTPYGRDTPL